MIYELYNQSKWAFSTIISLTCYPLWSCLLFYCKKIRNTRSRSLSLNDINWKILYKRFIVSMKRDMDTMFSKILLFSISLYVLQLNSDDLLFAKGPPGQNSWIDWDLHILFLCNTSYFIFTFWFFGKLLWVFKFEKKMSQAVY